MVAEGYDVTVCFPNGPFGEGERTSDEYGCSFVEIPIDRRGTNPLNDIKLLRKYKAIIKETKPDVVLAYTVKCDVYGGIACRQLHVPFIPNITGLGKGIDEGGLTGRITLFLYKIGIRKAKCVFFQNTGDKSFFDKSKVRYDNGIILPGSGVNLDKFVPLEYPTDEHVIFTYIARVMKAKGIEQYLDAARFIRKKYSNVEFHICGYCEEDYKDIIKAEEEKGTVVYHGLVDNIIDYERKTHCVVLPTFHPEGISNVLLEAAACARPLITTNRVGCREVVDDNISGYLVKERDSQDLIEKMEKFLTLTNEARKEMGLAGREKVEKEFDRQIVVKEYLKQIERI